MRHDHPRYLRCVHPLESVMIHGDTAAKTSAEAVLLKLCFGWRIFAAGQRILNALFTRVPMYLGPAEERIPVQLWRAFYNRHPEVLFDSVKPYLTALAAQFKAQDDATASMAAIHAALANHGISTAKMP